MHCGKLNSRDLALQHLEANKSIGFQILSVVGLVVGPVEVSTQTHSQTQTHAPHTSTIAVTKLSNNFQPSVSSAFFSTSWASPCLFPSFQLISTSSSSVNPHPSITLTDTSAHISAPPGCRAVELLMRQNSPRANRRRNKEAEPSPAMTSRHCKWS